MSITFDNNYAGLLSIITEQVQTKLLLEKGHFSQEKLLKAWGMMLWDVLCVNGTWSFCSGKIICWKFSSTAENSFFLQENEKGITNWQSAHFLLGMDLTCYKQRERKSGLRPQVNLEKVTPEFRCLAPDSPLWLGFCFETWKVLFSDLDWNTYDLYFLSKPEADKLMKVLKEQVITVQFLLFELPT